MSEFFKKAFSDMKESAKAQHEVSKAQIELVKAESKANFEENKGKNTLKRAKEMSKKSWDDAHMSPLERNAKMREECAEKVKEINERTAVANARYEKVKNGEI